MARFIPGTQNDDHLRTVVRGNTEFAIDLYHKLRESDGNLFFSPYIISVALAMTYAGARRSTADQMAHTCHFPDDQVHSAMAALEKRLNDLGRQGEVQLRIANSLWPDRQYPLLEQFLALAKKYYGVEITPVDYGDPEKARDVINEWVEQRTEDKIEQLIPPGFLSPATTLVLSNAIYFKGHWASPFEKGVTRPAPFHISSSQTVPAPMMTQEKPFGYAETEELQILSLPYRGHDLSMIVLLPTKADGLPELESALTPQSLAAWTNQIQSMAVRVFLPRFRTTCGLELTGTLQSMGMPDAFGGRADFSGMDGGKSGLTIGAMVHKAFIEVDEEGTEAAAGIASVMLYGIPPPSPVVRADHPFLYLIMDESTGSVMFMGRVASPLSAGA